jgi:hypothetical protein
MVQNRGIISVQPQQKPITIVISYINMAGQVFINDDLLWQDQSLVEPLSRSWNMPATGIYPPLSLNRVKILSGYVSSVKTPEFRFRSGFIR